MLLRECQQPAERQEFFVKEFVDVASRMRLEAAEERGVFRLGPVVPRVPRGGGHLPDEGRGGPRSRGGTARAGRPAGGATRARARDLARTLFRGARTAVSGRPAWP